MKKIFLILKTIISINAQEIYVSLDGSNLNTGSVDSPYRTIQKAINMSDPDFSTIYVGPGSFSPDSLLLIEDKNIEIYGSLDNNGNPLTQIGQADDGNNQDKGGVEMHGGQALISGFDFIWGL